MPIGTFPSEVLSTGSPAAIPDQLPAFEAIVGDSLNFTPQATIGSSTVTLVQKPSGSSASVSSGTFTCDVAGVYLVTLANAGFTRAWTVYAFAAATLNQTVGAGPNKVNRSHLRALVASLGPLAAGATNSLRTALEGATPAYVGPINWAAFGN